MNKTYDHEFDVKRARFAYEKNMKLTKKHNEEARRGLHTYELGANSMTDYVHSLYLKRFIRFSEVVHPATLPESQIDIDDKAALQRSIRHSSVDEVYIPESIHAYGL